MLHEAQDQNSATRRFHGQPVLAWALQRISRARRIGRCALLCWDDQARAVEAAAGDAGVLVMAQGRRQALPMIDAISASRRWCDGWRGGLLGTTCFDVGFHAGWIEAARQQAVADSVLIVDPASGLVDPELLDVLIEHAEVHPRAEYCFSPAAPGLSGMLIQAPLLQRLAATRAFPGRLLNYHPDTPGRDPISREECAPVARELARTTGRFTLDTRRQIERLERATADLNGQLAAISAESLLTRLAGGAAEPFPREIILEINTARRSRPAYWPASTLPIDRPELDLARAKALFAEIGRWDDLRLTLAGVGDPMLHGQVFEIIEAARDAGIRAIHLETDLLDAGSEQLHRLAEAPLDVISVQLPGLTASTYQRVMAIDALPRVIESLHGFFEQIQKAGRGTPLLAPTFVKLRSNLHEMEAWYDHWLGSVGCAVIAAPSDYAGQVPDQAAADMSPPARRACRRIDSRLSILSDGRIVACENDILGASPLGVIGDDSIERIWRSRMAALRSAHAAGRWECTALCGRCRDWHRP
jgi:hypothetical protein